MKFRELNPEGAVTMNGARPLACHVMAHETAGPLAHVCAGDLISSAWAEGDGDRLVVLSIADTEGKRGLSFTLTGDDARLLATSLTMLAGTVDGRRPS